MNQRAHMARQGGAFHSRLRRLLNVCFLALALVGASLNAAAPYVVIEALPLAAAKVDGRYSGPRAHIQSEIDKLVVMLSCSETAQSEGCARAAQIEKCCDISCHMACSIDALKLGSADVRGEPFDSLPASIVARRPSQLERPPRA